MKTLPLLLSLLFLASIAHGQEVVNPVRVSAIPATNDQVDMRLIDAFRSELRALRYVIAAETKPDYNILVSATPITGSDSCGGYAAAMLVIAGENRQTSLLIYTGDDLQSLARQMVKRLENTFFRPPSVETGKETPPARLPDGPPTWWARPKPKN